MVNNYYWSNIISRKLINSRHWIKFRTMKIENCINDKIEQFVSYDTKQIAECIKSRDNEFLVDLYFKNCIHSKVENLITCLLIKELLGYDPYDST